MQEELDVLRKSLVSERQIAAELASDCDRLASICNEKDDVLQVCKIIFVGSALALNFYT